MDYPETKDIFKIAEIPVKILWAGGIKVVVGQYYANLILVSALVKSELINDVVWKKYKYNLEKIEGCVFMDSKITNTKAFTHFWNWLNGAESHIVCDGLGLDDYLDMLDYLIHFQCMETNLVDLGEYLIEILSYKGKEARNSILKIKDKLVKFVESIYEHNKFTNVILVTLRYKILNITSYTSD